MRKCHLCEEVDVPLSSFFCERCFSIIRVGRMVLNLPMGTDLEHHNVDDVTEQWEVVDHFTGRLFNGGRGNSALAALEAAGIRDE